MNTAMLCICAMATAAALVGCAENRGGARYGTGRESGSEQRDAVSNFWYHDNTSTNAVGHPSTGTQTGEQYNSVLRPQ